MANIFLDSNETFRSADSGNTIFGSAGTDDAVLLESGVTGASFDGSVERVDLADNLANYDFQVTANGLEVSSAGQVVASFSGVAASGLDMRTSDGDFTLRQTGVEEFTATGAGGSSDAEPIGTSSTNVDVTLGNNTSQTASSGSDGGSGGSGGSVPSGFDQQVSLDGVGSISGTAQSPSVSPDSGAIFYTDSANSENNVTLSNFGSDDELQFSGVVDGSDDGSDVTVDDIAFSSSDGNTTLEVSKSVNGETEISQVTLQGVDGSVFSVSGFNALSDQGTISIA